MTVKAAPEASGITVSYKEVSAYDFQAAMDKLRATNFKDGGRNAYLVKKMSQALGKIRDVITKAYTVEIMDKYAKRDAEGNYRAESFQPMDDKMDEFKAELEKFEARTAVLDRPKFLAADIREANLNAAEQEGLDCILDDSGFEALVKKTPAKPAPVRAAT